MKVKLICLDPVLSNCQLIDVLMKLPATHPPWLLLEYLRASESTKINHMHGNLGCKIRFQDIVFLREVHLIFIYFYFVLFIYNTLQYNTLLTILLTYTTTTLPTNYIHYFRYLQSWLLAKLQYFLTLFRSFLSIINIIILQQYMYELIVRCSLYEIPIR